MPMTLEQMTPDLPALPEKDRKRRSDILEESFPPDAASLHPDWTTELRFQTAEDRAGRVSAVPLEDILRELGEEAAAA